MGGISFLFYNVKNPPVNIEFTNTFFNIKHRGTSDTSYTIESTAKITRNNQDQVRLFLSKKEIAEYSPFTFITGYHSMSINDNSKDASQPFEDPILHQIRQYPEIRTRPRRTLVCNGEIFNAEILKETEGFTERDLRSKSDVEVILPLYIKHGLDETLKKIDGDYTFILQENIDTFDIKRINVYVVRDILGTRPLYMVKHKTTVFYMFVSEIKAIPKFILDDTDYIIKEVPPGTYWSFQNSIVDKSKKEFINHSSFDYYKNISNCVIKSASPETLASVFENIKKKLETAVLSRYSLSAVPVGVLLSGGFDSSIILSILAHFLHKPTDQLHAFTIGNLDNPDVIHAKKCVTYLEKKLNIDIQHHIVSLDNLSMIFPDIDKIVYHLETFDPNVVTSSIPYTLLFNYIKEYTDVKVLLTGEGLDELCGYKEFFQLDDSHFQRKSVEIIQKLGRYDLLRCDKIASAYGLELRHPYLDISFMEYVLSIHPKLKRPQIYSYSKKPIEKYIIRKAFDCKEDTLLPDELLWRGIQDITECFTSNIRKYINTYCNSLYSDYDFSTYVNSLPMSRTVPKNKEEMHYRRIFESHFCNSTHLVPHFWQDLWE